MVRSHCWALVEKRDEPVLIAKGFGGVDDEVS